METQLMFWVQFGITVLGLIFIGYQTYIQKTRIENQNGIINEMKVWKEFIDIETMRGWMTLKEEKITLQLEKEKKEMEDKFKQSFEASESEHKKIIESTTDEANRRKKDLISVEQRLAETENALEDCRSDVANQEAAIEYYLKTNVELMNLAVVLTATYIPQERWEVLAEQYTDVVNPIFRDELYNKGIEIVKGVEKEREEFKNAVIKQSGFARKLFKGKSYPSELAKYQGDIKKYFGDE